MRPSIRVRVAALATDPDTFDELKRSALCLKARTGERLDCAEHTDDYPHTELILSFKGGRSIRVLSTSQQAMLIPWTIESDGKTVVTFAPELPHAIAALLPGNFCNRYRIGEESALQAIAEEAYLKLGHRAHADEAEARFGKQLAQLRPRFTIDHSWVDENVTPP